MAEYIADVGTNNNDTLRGSASKNWQGTSIDPAAGVYVYNAIYNFSDTISGLSGDDIIIGDLYDSDGIQNYGGDKIYGGLGNDTIYCDQGPDDPGWKTHAEGGSNTARGGFGNDTIYGGGGTGNSNADTLYGDEGNDTIYGLGATDYCYGGAGNDRIFGGEGNDWMDGEDGKDTLRGGLGDDRMYGGRGSDVIYGDDGNDDIRGESGSRDNLAKDTLTYVEVGGFVYVDLAKTGQQDTGTGGLDSISDIEILIGSNFNDKLWGRELAETLRGAKGNDVIAGRAGIDKLYGDAGNDKLDGGSGKDTLTGGLGKDFFNFTTPATAANVDRITDFKVVDDTIGLKKTIFKAIGAKLESSEFYKGSAAHDGSDHIIYSSGTGNIYYDADGKGGTAQTLICTASKGLAMTFNDFLMI